MGSSPALPVFTPKEGINYKYDYAEIFKDIALGNADPVKVYRTLILTDLWFVTHFVLGMPNANHQFIVNACREVEDGPKSHTLDIWAREHLKCMEEHSMVWLADGKQKAIKDIVAGDKVISLDSGGKSKIATVVANEYNGECDVVDIETVDGRKVSVTPNHRLLSFDGWQEASEFKYGSYIGIPRGCERETVNSMSDEAIVNAALSKKRPPYELFSQPVEGLRLYIRRIWSELGAFSADSQKANIIIQDRGLLEDIRVILLFIGIHSVVSDFGGRGDHVLTVGMPDDVDRLSGILRLPEDELVKWRACYERATKEHIQGDDIPIGWAKLLKHSNKNNYYLKTYGVKWNTSSSATSRSKVAMFAEIDGNDKLRQMVNNDIRWTKVYSVSPVRKARTYDLQVEDTQVYIANGFISHNTSIITIAETIQDVLKNPEHTHCIFSYVKPVAKRFLFTIKNVFENNRALISLFPEILYSNPQQQAQLWNLDEGIIVNRRTSRKEPTVCASGLTEGMITGMHFERRKYDDIVTEDIGRSYSVMEDVKLKFDSSENLGIDGGTHRVTGTFYNYSDPLVYIRDKRSVYDSSKSAYHYRFKPATADGTMNGAPVFLSQQRLNELKLTKTFRCQQLLDPSPVGTKKLDKYNLKHIGYEDLPDSLNRYMVIDPAGKKGDGDPWAVLLLGVPSGDKDPRTSDVYILKIGYFQSALAQTIRSIVKMYTESGKVLKLGVEQVGQSTAEVHIASELKSAGVNISEENGRLCIFRPKSRNKEKRIEDGLTWHLDNGRLYMVDSVADHLAEVFELELDGFPFTPNDHCIDALSYFILDLLPKLRLRTEDASEATDSEVGFSAYL